ncbi:MAG TPA: GNAT family N-acetyltransferase [Symbiobacteriaceae bacterium]|nr:GNAT family N-acetyltransferase [Symbiobacteriaceae bacterium]
MWYQIRPLDILQDTVAVTPLWRLVDSDPPSAEEMLHYWTKPVPEGGLRCRLVAADETGRIIGYGGSAHDPWDQAGRWFGRVMVEPEFHRRGIGTSLFERLVASIRSQGARVLQSEVRDSDQESMSWATDRGFRIDTHIYESTLDLISFDETPFRSAVANAEAAGIRFFSRAEDPSEETARKVCGLMGRTIPDIPAVHLGRPTTFDEWRLWALDETVVPRDCMILAADGDRIVGVTMLEMRDGGALYTGHTSVDREYRGRKLALALKLLSIRVALRRGAPYMRTHNNALNAPMLAVNRKLGYRPQPGVYAIEKEL